MHLRKLIPTALLAAGASAQKSKSLTALLTSNEDLSGLTTFISQYPDLASALNAQQNITILAPSNDAISALMQSGALESVSDSIIEAILSYHVLPGIIPSSAISSTPLFAHTTLNDTALANVTDGQVVEAVTDGKDVTIVSGLKSVSTVITPDLKYKGGIVHVIDTVLTTPVNVSTTAVAADLTAFVGGLTASNLITTLDTSPDITIFAPSNDAFMAAGSRLTELNTIQLISVFNYHVINGTVAYSSSLVDGSVETLYGAPVNITVVEGAIFVNEARVINTDILVSGGVIHVIDSVLNPNNTGTADPDAKAPAVQFAGASSAAVPSLTAGVPEPSTTIKALVATTQEVAAGYTAATKASGIKKTTTKSGIAAVQTGIVGAAALFGGAAMLANW